MAVSAVSLPVALFAEEEKTDTVLKKNGWYKEDGAYKYYKNDKAYTGWHKMGKAEGEKSEHWSYFGKDGKIYTGWHRMGKSEGEKKTHWSYFGPNGWLRTGWVQMGKGTTNPDGKAAKHWSYFGSNGWLRTGWVQMGKGTSDPDGNATKHWSYFGSNGWLRTGWVQMGKGTSDPDGKSAKHWSYFGKKGWLYTGWYTDSNGLHYFDGKGWMKQNTTEVIDGKYYCFNNIGVVKDTVIKWNNNWKYAGNSKIHSGSVVLYRAAANKRKGKVVAVNAGHGTKGGTSVKTLCHPDGSKKVTGGSTSAGSVYANAINEGTTLADGTSEAAANLALAKILKQKLLSAGYDVLMLRESSDIQLDNLARTIFANNCADYHVSLHYDDTSYDKGLFYTSVPNVGSYRNMQPVASNWRRHEALGQAIISGARKNGVKVYRNGAMPIDLTQTSYSTIPSVCLEVGDRTSSRSYSRLQSISNAIVDGLNRM